MALAGVASAVSYLGDMVVEEAKYLYEVEAKVEELQDELKWMMCFLQDVDSRRDRDARMRHWIRQISWLAYQCEDIIESFILKVELQRRGGMIKKLKRYSCIMREAKALHELGSDIDALKQKISTLTSRLHTYGIRTTDQGSSSSLRNEDQLRNYAHYEQGDIVGLEEDVKVVVKNLTADDIKIVALCGGGGLGKTTLAKKIYHHRDIRQYFDAVAWASVSQQCHVENVVTELLQGLTLVNPEKASNGPAKEDLKNTSNANNKKTLPQLVQELCEVQKTHRCLVVLDDIWKEEAWESLKPAFPNDKEISRGGKIMLTTRIEDVANYAEARIHKQQYMNDRDAWLLLGKKLRCDPPSNFFGEKHRSKAEKLAKEMLKHCGGLPLAIVALGGILVMKKSFEEWKSTNDNIKSLLLNAKHGGLSCKEVLGLSYYDLPFYLKPCFLYLGIFPEDTEISVTKLIHLWMAEGLLSTSGLENDNDDVGQQVSLEEVGQAYLLELVKRSMLQVGSTKENGRIKSCYLHDLVRETCISKAEEENFLKVLAVRDVASSSSIGMSSTPAFTMNTRKRYRRLAIHSEDSLKKLITSLTDRNKQIIAPGHVKSLLCYGDVNILNYFVIDRRAMESSILRKGFEQFRLLRVLDLNYIYARALPKGVGDLVHLRFLSIRDSRIMSVPSSIEKLESLQTLDLRSKNVTVEWSPDMIWRMRKLRHVYMPRSIEEPSIVEGIRYKLESCKSNEEEGGLNSNLEVLCNFMGRHRVKDVARLTNLRKLSTNYDLRKDEVELIRNCPSLLCKRLKKLSFQLRGELLTEEPDVLQGFSGLDNMKLEIIGVMSLSASLATCSRGPKKRLPDCLTSLTLRDTKIGNSDDLQILGNLPNLNILELLGNSFIVKDMTWSYGWFLKLTSLTLWQLKNLEEWIIEAGAMPSLLRLEIGWCINMKTFPKGIKSIPNLKKLAIFFMPKHFCDEVREWKESAIEGDDGDGKGAVCKAEDQGLGDSSKVGIQHIPNIKIYFERDVYPELKNKKEEENRNWMIRILNLFRLS